MELSKRQAEVVERVAKGMSDKRIAADLEISIRTVQTHIREAAGRIPGATPPRHKLTIWFFNLLDKAS